MFTSEIGNVGGAATSEAGQAVSMATSEAGQAASIVTSEAGQATSALASVIATDLPRALESILPRNSTLGTSQVCFGFAEKTPCGYLPLGAVGLGLGLALMVILIVISILFTFGWLSFIVNVGIWWRILRAAVHLFFGALCCLPFFIPFAIVRPLDSAMTDLPPWIQAQLGGAYRLCTPALGCAVGIVVVSSILRFFF